MDFETKMGRYGVLAVLFQFACAANCTRNNIAGEVDERARR
jgi:hypothetical protein